MLNALAMSYAGKNLKHLRKLRGWTQEKWVKPPGKFLRSKGFPSNTSHILMLTKRGTPIFSATIMGIYRLIMNGILSYAEKKIK